MEESRAADTGRRTLAVRDVAGTRHRSDSEEDVGAAFVRDQLGVAWAVLGVGCCIMNASASDGSPWSPAASRSASAAACSPLGHASPCLAGRALV